MNNYAICKDKFGEILRNNLVSCEGIMDRLFCPVGQVISAANWDKQSTWEALNNKLNIKSWSYYLPFLK